MRAELRPPSSSRRGAEATSARRVLVEEEPEEILLEPPAASPEVAELQGHVLALRAEGERMRAETAALRALVQRSLVASESVADSLAGFRALFRRVGNPKFVGAALVALELIPKIYKWLIGHL